jgi:hypothetical protein
MSTPTDRPSDRPPPPPGLVPTTYPAPNAPLEPTLPPVPPPPPVPAGYTHSRGITISPHVVAWVPVVFLSTIFALTFFNWIGSYVGGYPVFAQNAWQAMIGGSDSWGVTRSHQLEELMQQQANWPTAAVLDRVRGDWEVMLPYLLCLILATVLAWAERLVASLRKSIFPRPLQWITNVWPYRITIIAGLATIARLLLLVQVANGFGLQRAMRQVVSEKFADQRKAAEASPAAQSALDFKEDQELARFNLERTSWLYLVIVLHVFVVLAMLGRAWLDYRGDKPPPRLVIQY